MLIDLTSAQPQGNVIYNGGGEYSFIVFSKLLKYINNNSIKMDIILNSKLGENIKITECCNEYEIDIYYYNELCEFSHIINNYNYNKIILPVCYPKYSNLTIDKKTQVISTIHDLSSFYHELIKITNERFNKCDGLDWLRVIKHRLISKRKRACALSEHKKIVNMNINQQIITSSYYTKSSIEYYLKIKKNNKIRVLYPPINQSINKLVDDKVILNKFNLKQKKYFLLCSACRWTKNNFIALKAIDNLLNESILENKLDSFKIIVLGVNDIYERFYRLNIKNLDYFQFYDYISKDELKVLYKNTHLFIYPSLLEGFGLPPVEAMAFGTVSACSISTSIPEVCGEASIYFDPYDISSICLAIIKSFDNAYMDMMKENVKKRYNYLKKKQNEDLNTLIEIITN